MLTNKKESDYRLLHVLQHQPLIFQSLYRSDRAHPLLSLQKISNRISLPQVQVPTHCQSQLPNSSRLPEQDASKRAPIRLLVCRQETGAPFAEGVWMTACIER